MHVNVIGFSRGVSVMIVLRKTLAKSRRRVHKPFPVQVGVLNHRSSRGAFVVCEANFAH